MFLSYLTIMFK